MWTSFAYAFDVPVHLATLRAQPITSPDALTLAALAGLIAVTLIATLTILASEHINRSKHKVLATKIHCCVVRFRWGIDKGKVSQSC